MNRKITLKERNGEDYMDVDIICLQKSLRNLECNDKIMYCQMDRKLFYNG